jgi:hypothetical protein
VPTDRVAAATVLEALRRRVGLAFDLWADSTVDSTKYILNDAPCGTVAAVLLKRLPLGTRGLSADFAIEADSTGRAQVKWPMPLDSWVDEVRGKALLVPFEVRDETGVPVVVDLAIQPSGAFTVVPRLRDTPPNDEVACPPIAVLQGSAYAICQRFNDPTTRRPRLIGFQRPCT